jgi:hypothetical protein
MDILEIIEGLVYLYWLVVHWRITLCLIGSSLVAFFLVHEFSWLTGLQGIAIALCGGFILGAIWESKVEVEAQASQTPAPKTSMGVAIALAVLGGAVWGGASAVSLHSFLAGIAIFVLTVWGWNWYAKELKAWVTGQRAKLYVICAGLAYPLGAVLTHNFLLPSLV